ncbi:hypothetical protein QBC41DRAFT_324299 [Cercophora samala]|uniref:Uncharacterized protein n=1 Tax=Cercophora samala TaxID=330535 RepID=A0AA40DAY0_9PEZI|nr:hypothetical protein QBC41DRAFT_324299 [Cercophora samala]
MPFQQTFMNHWIQFRNPDPTRPNHPWLVLAVARLGPDQQGPHYPLAAFTIHPGPLSLLITCSNALRIFSDPLNHLAIRSELSLAHGFYTQPRAARPEQTSAWVGHPDFPFIATCLAVATTREEDAISQNVAQLSLSKVYYHFEHHYNQSRHRMLVIDVTHPTKVRYGIHHEPSPSRRSHDRWIEDSPSTRPLSVVDFITGCRFLGGLPPDSEELKTALEIACRWDVMDVPTLDFGWPYNSPQNPRPPVVNPPRSLRDQVFVALVRGASEMESLDMSVFEHVRVIPNFHNDLRCHLIQHSAHMGDHKPTAQLIAMALEGQEELDLTPFKNLTASSISIILGNHSPDIAITSISLCVDTLKSTPSRVLRTLARFPTIQNLYLSKLPGQRDRSSTKFLADMFKSPALVPKGHILVADYLSAPLGWARHEEAIPIASYQMPVDMFPVQHMFVRHQTYEPDQRRRFWPNYLPMGDLMLRPERFAAGFLQYILKSVRPGSIGVEASEKLFDFCSAPATLDRMYEDYQISQVPLESSSVPLRPKTSRREEYVGDCWPLVRGIEPNSWTVLVSLHHSRVTRDLESLSTRTHHTANWARYAFVRMKTRVEVTRPSVQLPPVDEIEVVGLKEFLGITSPGTDLELLDMRLEELEEKAAIPRQRPLPEGVKRLSVMEREEAVGILKDFLNNVEMVKKNLWAFMKENPANQWYPDLLEECNGQLCGSMIHGPEDIFVDSVNAQLSLEWWNSDPEDGDEDDDDESDE